MEKRYYWMKLSDEFFRQKTIKKLRRTAGGNTYTIIYLKMLLMAMKQDGKLYFRGTGSTFYDELAFELDESVENVKITVMFLLKLNLMQQIGDREYFLKECSEVVDSESASTVRSRKHRNKKASQCNTDTTKPLQKNTEPDPEDVLMKLPMNNGEDYLVTKEYAHDLQGLYPAIDVEQEFRNIRGWLDSNPRNRKTPQGMKRFITNWMARNQNRAPRVGNGQTGATQNRFNNFNQRDYDFESMERQLLNQ